MESVQNLKKRLKSVKNISQITKAMELVAATKMRKSQEVALASRPYAFAALDLLANLSNLQEAELPPILGKRPIQKKAFVVVASDKGLAGSFNSAVLREFEKFAKKEKIDFSDPNNLFISVGQKAKSFFRKQGVKTSETFLRISDHTKIEETNPLADCLTKGYLEKQWDQVLFFSTHFRSAFSQQVLIRQILPVDFENLKKTVKEIVPETGRFAELKKELVSFSSEKEQEYLIEPSAKLVLEKLAPYLVRLQIYHLILEANASEHAARRLAMKNASDNAIDLSKELTLNFNKARQASITKEIIEVTAGAESLKT